MAKRGCARRDDFAVVRGAVSGETVVESVGSTGPTGRRFYLGKAAARASPAPELSGGLSPEAPRISASYSGCRIRAKSNVGQDYFEEP